jgi:hypothetical protein
MSWNQNPIRLRRNRSSSSKKSPGASAVLPAHGRVALPTCQNPLPML